MARAAAVLSDEGRWGPPAVLWPVEGVADHTGHQIAGLGDGVTQNASFTFPCVHPWILCSTELLQLNFILALSQIYFCQ